LPLTTNELFMSNYIKSTRDGPSFGMNDRYGHVIEAAAPFPRVMENDLERLKNRLLRDTINDGAAASLHAPLRRAANEAAAIAWLEPFPLLVFPTLFTEKVSASLRQAVRQEDIRNRSAAFLQEAA
jgi:hypothetical protein